MQTSFLQKIEENVLESVIQKATKLLFSQQSQKGWWWYTLEANESIGSGFIQLMHFLEDVDPDIQKGLAARILSQQRKDGSWALFYDGPGDLSITVEAYFALKLAGYATTEEPLQKARDFILQQGGLAKVRAFTRIHLALFGLAPWSACPAMPLWFILLPHWLGISIYEFSSWARASIVPLLLIYHAKPVHPLSFDLDELSIEVKQKRDFNLFLVLDFILKGLEKLPWHPGESLAIKKAEQWTREHIERTEDIYPAMGYAALAFKALGYPNTDPTIQKAMNGLKNFQQTSSEQIHQQCCISPNWDTPWAGCALLESGVNPQDPHILKAGCYLLKKEIKDFRGDWRFKNPQGPASGWSFEFQNDYFPDIDDTIQSTLFLLASGVSSQEKQASILRALSWLLSMQSKNGGWAAFDKNNLSGWVNKIPFSDHGACLDPPTPDITGRMLELLSKFGYLPDHPVVDKAIQFLWEHQESFGAWRGRWGVNYIYGTWCVLQGLKNIGADRKALSIQKAVGWLKSVQNKDGGWGESCLSDLKNRYIPLETSVASQTAWALMGLLATNEGDSKTAQRGLEWLIKHQKQDGSWEEPYYTGTGFPGHFYIRYHGYCQYFPLLALGKYRL